MRLFAILAIVVSAPCLFAQETETLKVGIIGLDTSHVPAFTKAFNKRPADPAMKKCRVVAAYPHGSRDIESSYSRIPKYTAELKELGVDMVDSIDELLKRVDCVLLETNDGKPHLQQALRVFRANKPVFIDKPTGSNLSEVVAIYRAAQHFKTPMFSSSSLRFSSGVQEIRDGKVGDVLGCDSYGPCSLEPSHTDLFWYGIHGTEILFTCMGKGCTQVVHTSTKDFEFAVGTWSNGRIGTFRGLRSGKSGFGGTAFGTKAISSVGKYEGYKPLVAQIATFFSTRKSPIDPEETIQIYAFMQAALVSKQNGGVPVNVADVMKSAEQKAGELLSGEF